MQELINSTKCKYIEISEAGRRKLNAALRSIELKWDGIVQIYTRKLSGVAQRSFLRYFTTKYKLTL